MQVADVFTRTVPLFCKCKDSEGDELYMQATCSWVSKCAWPHDYTIPQSTSPFVRRTNFESCRTSANP